MHFYDTVRERGVGIWGDSITRATPYVDDGEQAYKIVGADIENSYRWVDARGVGGDDCDQVAARFACDGRGYEAVIIECGVNDVTNADTAAGIQGEIEGMLTTAAGCGVQVIIPSIMPFDGATAGQQSVIDDVNAWLATEASWTYINASAEFDDGAGDWDVAYYHDGTHPNAAGQAWLAAAYLTALGW
jgi:lysophospholipase L1-like esterase